MADKIRWITIRATQDDVGRLQGLSEVADGDKSVSLRTILRTANHDQVRKGIKRGQRRGM